MSLLSASPLLSSLFLTYANRAATLDGPAAPSPIDVEWKEMGALNNRLQIEVALLRDQLNKETDRAKVAEDCVEALRAQLSSVKCSIRDLETEVSDERDKLEAITSEYVAYKRETNDTIAELRKEVDKEAVSCPSFPARGHTHSAIECKNCIEPGHRGPTDIPCPIERAERESSPASPRGPGKSRP